MSKNIVRDIHLFHFKHLYSLENCLHVLKQQHNRKITFRSKKPSNHLNRDRIVNMRHNANFYQ